MTRVLALLERMLDLFEWGWTALVLLIAFAIAGISLILLVA